MPKTASRQLLKTMVLLTALSMALYVGSIDENIFFWDDLDLIANNTAIRNLNNIPVFFTPTYWKKFHPIDQPGQYRPVRTASFALDHALFGGNFRGYHFTNIVLNAVCVILVYLFFMNMLRQLAHHPTELEGRSQSETTFRLLPLFAALLFAAHPVHVETVVWIKNRSSLLAMLFLIPAFLCYLEFVHRPRFLSMLLLWLLGLPLFGLSIASYEMGITLPALLVLYGLLFSPAHRKAAIIGALPFFVVACLYVYLKFNLLTIVKTPGLVEYNVLRDTPEVHPFSHLLLVLATCFHYSSMLALPLELNVERMLDPPETMLDSAAMGGVFLITAMVLILVRFRNNRLLVFGLLWTVISLLPVSNIVYLWTRPLAEQRLYIPSMGFCLLMVVVLQEISRRLAAHATDPKTWMTRIGILLLCFVTTLYIVRTHDRESEWSDILDFWTKTTEQSPESARAWIGLATAYRMIGNLEKEEEAIQQAIRIAPHFDRSNYNLADFYIRLGKPERALDVYMRFIGIRPYDFMAYHKTGELYFERTDYENAELYFNNALKLNPNSYESYFYLGGIEAMKGNYRDAKKWYQKAIMLNPYLLKAINNLANVQALLGDYDNAIHIYRQALDIDPWHTDAIYNLGNMYLQKGDLDRAIETYHRLLTAFPDHVKANNNIGCAYLKKDETQIAMSYFQKAIALDPNYAEPYNNLAFMYLKREQFQTAIGYVDKAIALGWDVDPRFLQELAPYRKNE